MPYSPVDDLRKDIATGDVLVVVGAGVSLAATGGKSVASWKGLLKDGIDRCQGLRDLSDSAADALRADIDSSSLKRLLSAASKIRKVLGTPDESEVRIWLRDTVGKLRAKNREVLEAIRDLGLPIATTNYDDLLEEVTGWKTLPSPADAGEGAPSRRWRGAGGPGWWWRFPGRPSASVGGPSASVGGRSASLGGPSANTRGPSARTGRLPASAGAGPANVCQSSARAGR